MTRAALAFLSSILISSTLTIAASSPDPVKDCPKGLTCFKSGTPASLVEQIVARPELGIVPFTLPEAAAIDRKLITLQRDKTLAGLNKKRWANLSASVGAAYYPETGEYDPYAYVSMSAGQLGVWGGFSGSTPMVGVGWTW